MKFAKRIEKLPPYLFAEISRKIAEKRAQGIEVISFGIGDPDIPTPEPVIDALRAAIADPPNHRYPESEGLPEFREAVADWYRRLADSKDTTVLTWCVERIKKLTDEHFGGGALTVLRLLPAVPILELPEEMKPGRPEPEAQAPGDPSPAREEGK
ncbi:MAG: aminotransferase class I/II-fold pyridoxal phosphate-dependent enzyme [Planctomycetes bacterium]|nr:aminotransferase class I/II-fold pyridoxal phosphate-dependent enzyme [Planctomycetota bacterium]